MELFTAIPPLRPSPRQAEGKERSRHGARPRTQTPGQPEVLEILRACPWAGLYDPDGRAYGWLPRANPLRQSLLEGQVGSYEGVRDWSLEDMQEAEEKAAAAVVRRAGLPQVRVKKQERIKPEDVATADLMRLAGVATIASAEETKQVQKRVSKTVTRAFWAHQPLGLAPASELLPSGNHLLWVWLPSRAPGLWQKLKMRRLNLERDVSAPELDFPQTEATDTTPVQDVPLFHWESNTLVARFTPHYYPEYVDPRSKRRVACLVGRLTWVATPPAVPTPTRFPQLLSLGAQPRKRRLSPDPWQPVKESEPEPRIRLGTLKPETTSAPSAAPLPA